MGASSRARVALPRQIGHYDHITLLPSRRAFLEEHAVPVGAPRVLVLVTLADARAFNEILRALGHAGAEAFVRNGATRVASQLGTADLFHVSVLSFAFLTPEVGAEDLAARLARAFREPLLCDEIPIDTRVGVGLRSLPGGRGADAEDLRAALAAAQDSRGMVSGWAWYDKRTDDAHQRAFQLLTDIKAALRTEGQLALHYQPKVALASGACTAGEALVRWTHPDLGPISPGEFIPLVEATALVTPLTRWVISAAVTELSGWRRQGAEVGLAINVSPKNLEEPDFVEYLLFCCAVRGLPHSALELEITEGVSAAGGRGMLEQLAALRALGFGIAIDDFGSGYSNMSYLTRLSAQTLKIDQSLVRGMRTVETGTRLVAGIVKMGHDLGYRMVAEGIETEEDCAILARLGCDFGQGWLFGRPMPAAGFIDWLAARS